jgi:predicted short-subunit dehydrogenase-like oxidoreductase (DUF2520 family)
VVLRIVVIGPGRVGLAFARQFHRAGIEAGLVGRDPVRTARAVAQAGCGRAATLVELAAAHVVLFAVGDAELPAAIAAAAAAAPVRRCSLWLHTSGRHGLEVFAPVVGAGCRRGALHPVAPFPAVEVAAPVWSGAPAVIEGDPRSQRLLRRLCGWLGLQPLPMAAGADRGLYHAACALAANGTTALRAVVDRTFAGARGLAAGDAALVADALMAAALQGCRDRGPIAALSGPVRRGDATTVQLHLQRLQAQVAGAVPSYRALMQVALELAVAGGLPPAAAAAVAAALREDPAG